MVLLSLNLTELMHTFIHSSLLLAFYVPQDQYGATPLQISCVYNHPQVASYLISKGARANYQEKVIHYPGANPGFEEGGRTMIIARAKF